MPFGRLHKPSLDGRPSGSTQSHSAPPSCRAAQSRRTDMEIASLADLLHETSEHHGAFEAVAPPHDWWDWYAAYIDARQSESSPDEASVPPGATWPRPKASW